MSIIVEGEKDIFTIRSEPKVIVERAVSFTCCGIPVGSIDATYDFSDLPPELHSMAIQTVLQRSMNICLPYDFLPPSHEVRQRMEAKINRERDEARKKLKQRKWWRFW